ncbi:hypothetical protein [Ruania alba]|uniref:Uncharacterized protein n=1 Tax=Ruania alba TaxID=648782 RepID=A0A1H5BJZ4_9MICO|nr:hypothetical protein [Ruania alba]SED54953.1 hypothetical protein SAMN04488554_0129 [Ruania alba]
MGRAEDEFIIGGDVPPSGTAAEPPTRPPRRRTGSHLTGPWPWAGLAVLLVLAGAVTAPRPGPVVDPWGRVPDLSTPPVLAWELEHTEIQQMWAFRGVLAVAAGQEVIGLDSRTGVQRWSVSATLPRCTSSGTELTCVIDDSTVLAIDPRSGTAREQTVDGIIGATQFGGDLIALTESGIRRIAPDGTILWAAEEDAQAPQAWLAGPDIAGGMVVMLRADTGGFGSGFSGLAALDPETGAPVESPGGYPVPVRDGVWAFTSGPTTEFLLRGKDEPMVSEWPFTFTTMTDPSVLSEPPQGGDDDVHVTAVVGDVHLGVALGESPQMVGLDSSGAVLWRSDQTGGLGFGPDMLVGDGAVAYQLISFDGQSRELGYIGVHAETGDELWRIPGDHREVTSDGTRLYLLSNAGIQAWTVGG